MPFNAFENSEENGAPALLVTVSRAGLKWRYTNSEYDLTRGGEIYSAVPVSVANLNSDASMNEDTMTLKLPRTVPLMDFIMPTMSIEPIHVEIYQTHIGDTDQVPLYVGTVVSAALDEERTQIQLGVQSGLHRILAPGSARKWQRTCPLALYGGQCRAIVENSQIITNGYLSGSVYLFAYIQGSNPSEPHIFRGRDLRDETQRFFLFGSKLVIAGKTYFPREVSAPLSDKTRIRFQLTATEFAEIQQAWAGLPTASQTITVIPNCERSTDCCDKIHNNIRNFGGQPHLENKSKVGLSYVGGR